MAGNPIVWLDLKTVRFIVGRAATEKDVSEDRIHVDGETKKRTLCILIQAEQAGETKYGGCRSVAMVHIS